MDINFILDALKEEGSEGLKSLIQRKFAEMPEGLTALKKNEEKPGVYGKLPLKNPCLKPEQTEMKTLLHLQRL